MNERDSGERRKETGQDTGPLTGEDSLRGSEGTDGQPTPVILDEVTLTFHRVFAPVPIPTERGRVEIDTCGGRSGRRRTSTQGNVGTRTVYRGEETEVESDLIEKGARKSDNDKGPSKWQGIGMGVQTLTGSGRRNSR